MDMPSASPKFQAVQSLLLVIVFTVLWRWIIKTLSLPEESYQSPFITSEIIVRLLTTLKGLVGLVPLLILLIFRSKELFAPWSDYQDGSRIRLLIMLLVFLTTWSAVTVDYNLWYDQAHDLDRLLLFVLGLLVFWRPVFLIPFLFLFYPLEHQFDHPFGRQIFAQVIIENLMTLFVAMLVVRALTRRNETDTFLFVAFCLFASFYWYTGYTKLVKGWLFENQPYLSGFASYANGWLAFLPIERFTKFMELAAFLDWPSRIITLGTEITALLFFAHRNVSRALLLLWTMLHLGIWVFSGITFMVWIVLNLVFLGLFFLKDSDVPLIFSWRHLAVGGALMLLSPVWVQPPAIGWYDTRLVYTYRYEAIDSRGKHTAFPADATPLGYAWCARDFPFLSNHPTLMIRYGKTYDRKLAKAVMASEGGTEGLIELEDTYGKVYFNPEQTRIFEDYLRNIARNWNRRGSEKHWLSWASPPRTCLSPRAPPEPVIASGSRVQKLTVYQLTFWFDGETFRQIRRIPVSTIDVSG